MLKCSSALQFPLLHQQTLYLVLQEILLDIWILLALCLPLQANYR